MPRTRNERLRSIAQMMQGKVLDPASTVDALQRVLEPGDRVALEGNNQKQADYLSRSLAQVSPRRIHDLHMVMPCLTRQEHLDLFESGLARRADFAYCGPLPQQVARAITEETLQTSAIHTYLELYARMYLDLAPRWRWWPRKWPTLMAISTPAPTRKKRR